MAIRRVWVGTIGPFLYDDEEHDYAVRTDGQLPSGDIALEGLTNVVITDLQPGQALVFDGTNWVNEFVSPAGPDAPENVNVEVDSIQYAIGFNGSSSYLQTGEPHGLPAGSSSRYIRVRMFTVAHSNNSNTLISYGSFSTGELINLRVDATVGSIVFIGWQENLTVNTDPFDNEWVDIGFSYDGTTVKVYINGEEKGSDTLSLDTGSSSRMEIGRMHGENTNVFQGLISKVDVWDTDTPTTENGNILCVPMLEGIGDTAEDISGNENHLELMGSAHWFDYGYWV